MANEIKIGNSHPVTENLSTITVGNQRSSLEIAKVDKGARIRGNLECTNTLKCDVLNTATLKNFTSTDLIIDDSGDITLDAGGGNITLLDDGGTYTPTAGSDATTKTYVDTYINCPSIPFFFNETTASRTYFRNADDAFNAWEWDSYDTEDSTSVDATINLAASNLLAGYVVGFACTIRGAVWNTYQANAVSGVAHFQIWTSDPSASAVATLRTTNQITANRAHATTPTSTINVDLAVGDVILPAIQYASGTSTSWYGGVTLLLERT